MRNERSHAVMQDWTPVFSAVTENQVAALQVLVAHGARLDRVDRKVNTFSSCENIRQGIIAK